MTKSICRICFALVTVAIAHAQWTETVLHNFAGAITGKEPDAGVIVDSAGNLYGTTKIGGKNITGTVYKVDPSRRETVLYSFTGGADGAYPLAGVIRDASGNFYGTTERGGSSNAGVVYKLDKAGHETVLHSFTGGADGSYPWAGVIRDASGNLYGTTKRGGSGHLGVVYELGPKGNETLLYSFSGPDGSDPRAGVVSDAASNLYGTTYYGGTANKGVIFKLDTTGHETVLYSFSGVADGANPTAGVVLDSAGNLYGTASKGGANHFGTVYKLDTSGNLTVLHAFTGSGDGTRPYGGVILDSAGNLYGTTYEGGAANGGVIYEVSPNGNETVLYTFIPADLANPMAGLTMDSAGNLYGTCIRGDSNEGGGVYELDPAGNETARYRFGGAPKGTGPVALIRDSAGNFYGTTDSGGSANLGTVYKLDAAGVLTVLHAFTGGSDGAYPHGGLILDSGGTLYGTTRRGGLADSGVVYAIGPEGGESILYAFNGGTDGSSPFSGVVRDASGNLYGTTVLGGSSGQGAVFKLDTGFHESVLYSFTGGADGSEPYGGVIFDASGNLYGTTAFGGASNDGVVYKLDTAGNQTVLYTFLGGSDGSTSFSGVVLDSAGNLYGTGFRGGALNYGVVYEVDTTGHESVLYSFTGSSDGEYPSVGVIRDAAGNTFGTASGGTSGNGVVYQIDAAGQFSVLYSFKGGESGSMPTGGIIEDAAGNLYGSAYRSKRGFGGLVFQLTPD